MPHAIDASTFRVLHPNGNTVGTGFLVAPSLAVTCAHVIVAADAIDGDTVQLQFTGQMEQIKALVLSELWSDPGNFDVAILQLEKVPAEIHPLRLERAATCRLDAKLYTFGYARAADEIGISGYGDFRNFPTGNKIFQFRMHEADCGHSGAPVLDEKRGVVIGMVQKGETEPGRNAETTFAIPTEIIWQVCSQLKPTLPPLPRRNPIVEGIDLLPYDYYQRIQNFLTEYLGTEKHPVPFGGRDEALHMLDTWLAETMPYLLLAAPAGRGKSALLVRWLDSLKDREDLALAFVPVSIRFGMNMERVFYATLAARLAFLHGDDVPASPDTSTAVYRGLVSDYLSKPLANGRSLLVVLDGLDEAADWRAGADFMPGELPAGVRVVVSARFLAGDVDSIPWLRRLNWERNGLASAPSLTPLNQEGVRDVLFKMGCPLDELSHQVDIVAELYRLSDGDPLLVGLYVGDLWAKGETVARLQPQDLAGIQPGYKGYFNRWWDDQKRLWGKEKPWLERHVRTVRNLLAGALEPLFVDDIQALEPDLESDFIINALDVLQRFIIGDNQTQGYTFSHPRLEQYFWEILTLVERAQVEEQFLVWCEQTLEEFIEDKRDSKQKTAVPEYVVRNYGAHLTRADQPIEKWLPLIHHEQWAQAWFTVEGAYGGYLQDIQRVWQKCDLVDKKVMGTGGKAIYIGQQIRCALIESSIHSLASNIPPDLLRQLIRHKIWTPQQAIAYIRQMTDSDQQFQSITDLISYLLETQSIEVLEVTRILSDDEKRASVLGTIAQRMPEYLLDQMLSMAYELDDEENRAYVLNSLIKRFPEGSLYKLLNAGRSFKSQSRRIQIISSLAHRMPDAANEAFDSINNIEGNNFYEMNLLAEYLPETYLIRLLEVLRIKIINLEKTELDHEETPFYALCEEDQLAIRRISYNILQRLPEFHLDEFLRALMESLLLRESIDLVSVAERLMGTTDETLNLMFLLTLEIDNEWEQGVVLSEIAKWVPENWLGKLLNASLDIKDERALAEVLYNLAQCLPQKHLETILKATYRIQNEWEQYRILRILAGRIPNAVENALTTVLKIKEENDYVEILCDIAVNMPKSQLRTLMKKAYAIQDEEKQASVMNAIASRIPEVYLVDLFNSTLKMQNTSLRIESLRIIAKRSPEYLLNDLLEELNSIYPEEFRIKVISELASSIPDRRLGDLLKAVRKVQTDWVFALAMGWLVQRIPELSRETFEATKKIKDFNDRQRILIFLVQRLSENSTELFAAIHLIPRGLARVRILNHIMQRIPKSRTKELLEFLLTLDDESDLAETINALDSQMVQSNRVSILSMVNRIHNQNLRINTLIGLAQHIPEAALEALELVQKIQIESSRTRIFGVLAQYVPEAAEDALSTTRMIVGEDEKSSVLKKLIPYLPVSKMRDLLEIAFTIENEIWERAQIMIALVKRLPEASMYALESVREIQDEWARSYALMDLAECLSFSFLDEFLDDAYKIQKESLRTSVLRSLRQRLMGLELDDLAGSSHNLQLEWVHIKLLTIFAKRLPSYLFRRVISAEWPISYQETVIEPPKTDFEPLLRRRSAILGAFAHNLPEKVDDALDMVRSNIMKDEEKSEFLQILVMELPESRLEEIIDVIINNIRDEWARVRVLTALAPRLSENLFERVFPLVIDLQNHEARANVFSKFVHTLIRFQDVKSYFWYKNLLMSLSAQMRGALFSDISALFPLVIHHGGDNTTTEIYQAVRDVTTWWP